MLEHSDGELGGGTPNPLIPLIARHDQPNAVLASNSFNYLVRIITRPHAGKDNIND